MPTIVPAAKGPADLAYSLPDKNLPVFGVGSLLRVLRVEQVNGSWYGFDPFTGIGIRTLSTEEASSLGNFSYALDRYGATTGKRLALTFDDGPDLVYTTKILDILSREGVPSTFFVIGSNVVKHPDVARRIIREGHVLGNHTFFHADFDFVNSARAREEINMTERVIRAATGTYTGYFRLPYGGFDDKELRDNLRGILQAQQLGYTVTSYDIDTNDWQFSSNVPERIVELDGNDHVILLHDAGGNRDLTIDYLVRLIAAAKAQGYSFTTLEGLFSDAQMLTGSASVTFADRISFFVAYLGLTLPTTLMYILFIVSFITALAVAIIFILLALVQSFVQRGKNNSTYLPLVSIIVPAFNEEKVLAKTLHALRRSHYRNIEIIVVDDGSTDKTPAVIASMGMYPEIRAFRQENAGKAAALNRGVFEARGDILVTLDADTVFAADAIGNLVRHFANPRIGAVAGVIKVGNAGNLLTACQSLEYISGIAIDRRAQSLIGAITIVPGACAAWRKQAVLKAGGYSGATLAEDCDLSLAIQKAGFRVIQDNRSIAYTEVPTTMRSLAKQRFRWTFGTLQSLWKHRSMFFRRKYGTLGLFILPYTALSIIAPLLFLPLIYTLTVKALITGQAESVIYFFAVFTVSQFVTSLFGVLLAREHLAHLLVVPIYRIIYEPLRTYLLYRSLLTVLKGTTVGWNKVPRTGTVFVGRVVRPLVAAKAG